MPAPMPVRPRSRGWPVLTLPLSGQSVTVGGWLHRGQENLRRQLGDDANDVAFWSWGDYLSLPLDALTLSGEAWTGANLDAYVGGIAHGIRVRQTVATAVESTGGWAELA
jgi:hypothetical protein